MKIYSLQKKTKEMRIGNCLCTCIIVVFDRADKAFPVGDMVKACWRSTWFSDSILESFSSSLKQETNKEGVDKRECQMHVLHSLRIQNSMFGKSSSQNVMIKDASLLLYWMLVVHI